MYFFLRIYLFIYLKGGSRVIHQLKVIQEKKILLCLIHEKTATAFWTETKYVWMFGPRESDNAAPATHHWVLAEMLVAAWLILALLGMTTFQSTHMGKAKSDAEEWQMKTVLPVRGQQKCVSVFQREV